MRIVSEHHHHFKCDGCGKDTPSDTSVEEMMAEYKRNFPECIGDEMLHLCDDCYRWNMSQIGRSPI